MKKTVLILIIGVLICMAVGSMAQIKPLTDRVEYKVRFRPVLVPTVVDGGYSDGSVAVSDTIQLQYGLKVVE